MRYIKTYKLFESNIVHYPEFMYHGTNAKFNKFELTRKGANFNTSSLGLYFSQYIQGPPYGSTAKEYADEIVKMKGGDPIIYKCKLDFKNPLVLNSNGWYSSNTVVDNQRNDIIRWMKDGNHDAVVVYDWEEKDEKYKDYIIVVPDPEQVEIVDTIKVK